MLLGTVQISGETLSNGEVRDICEGLRRNSIKMLSLRGCRVVDRHFVKLTSALAECHSISQLNLNLGVVCNKDRVHCLANALAKNRSLTGLFLHGSPLGDEGLSILMESLAMHPGIVNLDVGDCHLHDEGVSSICRLLQADGAKLGLKELTLSANPGVTHVGWAKLALAIAAGCSLRILNVDYNRLGDFGAGVLAVATASCKTLQVLDMESTGISENGAKILLALTDNYPTNLSDLVVKENGLKKYTERAISASLGIPDAEDDEDDDDYETTSSEDSDTESPREKTINRTPRKVQQSSQSPRVNDERMFERTAMRLLKRTVTVDGKLPGQRRRRRRESATESDSEYSSASSELDEAFLAQSAELLRKTELLTVGSRQKHAPAIQVPKPVETDYWTPADSPVAQLVKFSGSHSDKLLNTVKNECLQSSEILLDAHSTHTKANGANNTQIQKPIPVIAKLNKEIDFEGDLGVKTTLDGNGNEAMGNST